MSAQVTYCGYVPTWEIDVNAHWNTEFYIRAFQHASERFHAFSDIGNIGAETARVRHIRFFRELRALETMEITSDWLADDFGAYTTVHIMRNAVTRAVAACAYDQPADVQRGLPDGPQEHLVGLGPRSLYVGAQEGENAQALIRGGKAHVTHLGVLRTAGFDHTGQLTMSAIHNCVSDGTGHLWQAWGVTPSDFYDNGLGRAIVEIKLSRCHLTATRPGQAIRLVSWFADISQRTVQFRHQLEDLVTGQLIAVVNVVTLILDMKARRAVSMPDAIRQKLFDTRN